MKKKGGNKFLLRLYLSRRKTSETTVRRSDRTCSITFDIFNEIKESPGGLHTGG